MKRSIATLILFITLSIVGLVFSPTYTYIKEYAQSLPRFINSEVITKELLYEAFSFYNISNQDIVYAQAILETGYFRSNLCKKNNNLFGLYNSKKGKFMKFPHWHYSVKAYAKFIQNRYKPPGDYYSFLTKINYAEGDSYNNLLKKIVNEQRRNSR